MSYSDYAFNSSLEDIDSVVSRIIEFEEERQARKIIMIPSESICPPAVLKALGSVFNNVYAEGYPPRDMRGEDEKAISDFDCRLSKLRRYSDRRFYKGCDYVDFLESLAQRRASELFATHKNPASNIFVNVQPLSGACANNAVYDAFVEHGEVVMGMSLIHGGHLSHGSEFNRSGKNYRIVAYEVSKKNHRLDYDEIMKLAVEHKPKLIIAGYTSYPWAPDWKRFREIADSVGAKLFADISHTAGLVTAGVYPNPIDYADVVTCTTHKTLFGPRGAIILTTNYEYAEKIDQAVFPGEQGGPHANKFAAMAVAFKIAKTNKYIETQKKIAANAKYLGEVIEKNGIKLAYGGTNTHLLMVDLNSIETTTGFKLKGEIAVRMLDLCGIVANKNTIPGDTATSEASGVRLGTPWITQRGITRDGIEELGNIISYILKNINPFTYEGLTGTLPRGKIELDILQATKRKVETLVHGLVSVKKPKGIGYPHYSNSKSIEDSKSDFNDKSIIYIRGDRALQFLEEISTNKISTNKISTNKISTNKISTNKISTNKISTNKISDIRENNGCKSFLLDKNAKLIAPIFIYRLKPVNEREDQFIIVTKNKFKGYVIQWFRGLSDGYLVFDSKDIFKKIEGPVVVLDKKSLLERDYINIEEIIETIKKLDIDLPDYEKGTDSEVLYNKFPERFDFTKPYFIGQAKIKVTFQVKSKKTFKYEAIEKPPMRSVLYDEHKKLTKNIVPFAGWEMPIRYEGIIEEHRAVRETAGLFDVTHMGVLEVAGRYATQFLDVIDTNYAPWIKPGDSQYGYMLDPEGNPIDDIMIYKFSKEKYMVVVNASNNEKDLAWLNAVNKRDILIDLSDKPKEIPGEVVIRDLKDPKSIGKDSKVDMAIQGPQSLNILKAMATTDKIKYSLEKIEKTQFIETELQGIPVVIARTGYTGEKFGYEIFVHPDKACKMWNIILEKGRDFGVKPVGLGARDSLRVEAGLPLYGHELAGHFNISPIEAGFGPYVKLHKPYFIGRKAIIEKLNHLKMSVVRFRMSNKGVKMAKTQDFVISKRSQKAIGWVTSCAVNQDGFQVGMAYIDNRFTLEGTKIGIVALAYDSKVKKSTMDIGDRYYLHEEATILSRFPKNE